MKTAIVASLALLQSVSVLATPMQQAKRLLVAIEGGGAVELDASTGSILGRYTTGANAFGALYDLDGRRAFVTDKSEGTLSVLESGRVTTSVSLGKDPQQPALSADGRLFIPLSGEAAIAVVDVTGAPTLLRKIPTGEGTRPHIVSISPDRRTLYATVQGRDPKVVAIAVSPGKEEIVREYRYDLVPRVVAAFDGGAFYTAHHSTGLHLAAGEAATTPYMDVNGAASEARKQIEGIAVNEAGTKAAITHEGRKALVLVSGSAAVCDISPLSEKPYWTTLDPSGEIAYVSIPGSSTVEAYDVKNCAQKALWSVSVGGKPKRMDVTSK